MAVEGGVGLGIAGNITQAVAQYQAARVAQKTLRFNADVATRNAEQTARFIERDILLTQLERQRETEALAFDLDTFDRTADLAQSATMAAIGASGTEFTGSNLVVAMHQAEELGLQRSVIRFLSEERQAGLTDDAALLTFQAEEVRRGGQFEAGLLREQARTIRRGLPLTLTATALSGASGVNQQIQAARVQRAPRARRGVMTSQATGQEQLFTSMRS